LSCRTAVKGWVKETDCPSVFNDQRGRRKRRIFAPLGTVDYKLKGKRKFDIMIDLCANLEKVSE